MAVTIGVSFDLLGSLIAVHPSAGHQYAIDMVKFLEKKGIREPNINIEILDANAFRALKTELTNDRAKWVSQGLGEAKMMPIGGTTEESVLDFWSRVIHRSFDDDGAFCNYDKRVMSVLQESSNSPEWNEFLKSVFERFATPEPYRWLPEALPTLSALEEWRGHKHSRGIKCTPPAILTNADYRFVSVVKEMVKQHSNKPLIGSLFSADRVGVGKPSARGISLASKASGVTSMKHWIHVGDGEEDRLAAERAGCHFLHCSPTKGPEWARLRGMLEEVCGSVDKRVSVAT
ncbi:uncharacterized protein TM35_000221120 [Trypanosoma theileri]|uniref:Haloacid dehalogenase-like hydrolase n=1 Tax=Trypanosoma theileri TaxID=67003 RepID=A0A1X0NS57_9TRYP|nr:uncharacterized protein TM35_000221120 [Trypanosoma theileri]ORC87313.1 hypothetical protein TM35_000221120 [Trypanosoma theileri]